MEDQLYTALNPSRREIRVLTVAPGHRGEPVTSDLHVVSLNEQAQYSAISYVWGGEEPKVKITVNGVALAVGLNCFAALRGLRGGERSVALWIDAICINQKDLEEKSTQIQLMGDVYRQSQRTFIWLGDRFAHSDGAMALVCRIGTGDLKPAAIQACRDDWSALFKLLRHPWWSRMWVLQEVVQSQEPIVCCGSALAPFGRFIELFNAVRDRSERPNFTPKILFQNVPFSLLLSMWDMIKPGGALKSVRLIAWLEWSEHLSCRDPRDRIYALLSLSSEIDRSSIPIVADSTKKSDREVFLELAGHTVHQNGLLVLNLGRHDKSHNYGLPSWVPDWSAQQFPATSSLSISNSLNNPRGSHDRRSIEESELRADGTDIKWRALGFPRWRTAGEPEKSTAHLISSREVLATRGITVDRIEVISDEFLSDNYQEQVPKKLSEAATSTLRLVRQRGLTTIQQWESAWIKFPQDFYSGICTKSEAFWRTLLANRARNLQTPPVVWEDQFESWIGRNTSRTGTAREAFEAPFAGRLYRCCFKRRFAITSKGLVGLVPQTAKVGDLVCILYGGQSPYILRERGDEYHTYVGESYIHGAERGAFVSQASAGDVQEFWLH